LVIHFNPKTPLYSIFTVYLNYQCKSIHWNQFSKIRVLKFTHSLHFRDKLQQTPESYRRFSKNEPLLYTQNHPGKFDSFYFSLLLIEPKNRQEFRKFIYIELLLPVFSNNNSMLLKIRQLIT